MKLTVTTTALLPLFVLLCNNFKMKIKQYTLFDLDAIHCCWHYDYNLCLLFACLFVIYFFSVSAIKIVSVFN